MDRKLKVVAVPVSGIEQDTAFYPEQPGFYAGNDTVINPGNRRAGQQISRQV